MKISAVEEFPENSEDDETVILTPSVGANLNSIGDTTITIKNNTLEFEKKDNPFIELSKVQFHGEIMIGMGIWILQSWVNQIQLVL